LSFESIDTAESALAAAWQLQRSGNFVAAFDRAQEALARWPDSQALQHVSILALASCGSTQAALSAYRASSLAESQDEDCLALEARILKDLALDWPAPDRSELLVRAALAYERVAQRAGATLYPKQNAAALWMMVGSVSRAEELARSVADALRSASVPSNEEAAYWHWAMLAEAALVLGDRGTLALSVTRANGVWRQSLWARSRTFAQMRRLSLWRTDCDPLVNAWYLPPVGFVLPPDVSSEFRGTLVPCAEGTVPAMVYGVGSSAAATHWQSLAIQGIQVHLIFAGASADEGASIGSNRPAADRQASGRTDSYTWSSLLLEVGEEHEGACAEAALGLSMGHAQAVQTPWIALMRNDGHWSAHRCASGDYPSMSALSKQPYVGAARYAFLFADAVGYSSLNAADTRRYWTRLLPETAGAALRRHADTVLLRKTWGDAIHGVFRSARAAARAALEMTADTARLAEELALGRRLSFRVALHYGSADHGTDPIEQAPSYFGPQLTFAARIEPVTPPGGIFLTEPLAARLSLEGGEQFRCTYVGTTSLAKGYGRVRLLSLATAG
jgi:class 3 adenylate cyclase